MRTLTAGLFVVLMALAGMAWYSQQLAEELKQANQMIGTLSAGLQSRDTVIEQLQNEFTERQISELALRESLSQAGAAALVRERKIQRLTNENETLRRWTSVALPDDIIRLHQRPAFPTADDYLRWLSEGHPLPHSGEPTAK